MTMIGVSRFIDVTPGDWFYDDIMEASNLLLEDGDFFVQGIPYSTFEDGKPYLYHEYIATGTGVQWNMPTPLKEITSDNPLYVFVDGTQVPYKSATWNSETQRIEVVLFTPPPQGSLVQFISYGVPKTNEDGIPSASAGGSYPTYRLEHYEEYVYYPYQGYFETVHILGKQLRRAWVTDKDLDTMGEQALGKKYIGFRDDIYVITKNGRLIVPYKYLNMTGVVSYTRAVGGSLHNRRMVRGEEFKARLYGNNVPLHTNRFFPNAKITRVQAMLLINRLREHFYSRFTDLKAPDNILEYREITYTGQRVFRLNGYYQLGKGLEVRLNGKLMEKGVDYEEFDSHTVLFKYPLEAGNTVDFYFEKKSSDHLIDVGYNISLYNYQDNELVNVNGTTASWVKDILALEGETFHDGERLIVGLPVRRWYDEEQTIPVVNNKLELSGTYGYQSTKEVNVFMPHAKLARSEAVAFINRFRKWCMERFL